MNVKLSYVNAVKLMRVVADFQVKASEEQLQVPGKVSYALHKNEKSLVKVYEEFEKYRLLIIDTYGKKDKNGNPILVDGVYQIELQDKFDEEFKNLCNKEISIPLYKFVDVDSVVSNIEGSQDTLNLLWHIIDIVGDLQSPKKPVAKLKLETVK